MPPDAQTHSRPADGIKWKRPEADSYTDPSDALERGTCYVTVNHPNFASKIKRVRLKITLDEDRSDLEDDLQDAATSNEHLDVSLSLEGIDERLEPLDTKIEPKSRPAFGSRPFTFIVREGKRKFAPHFSYQ